MGLIETTMPSSRMFDKSPKWICTDPDCKQYGRQLSPTEFEFREKGRQTATIELKQYSEEEIEDTLIPYGYTQGPARKGLQNLKEQFPNEIDRNWTIAEMIYETEIEFNI